MLDRLSRDLGEAVENLVWLPEVDSTQAVAGRLIEGVDDEETELRATVVIAGRQSAGRGRGDHRWSSPEGGLYLSWLRSGVSGDQAARLPMLAASATWRALAAVGLRGHRIKWPNDLLVDGTKVAGLLVTARHGEPHWAVVGLGVNLESAPDPGPGALHPAGCLADSLGSRSWQEWAEPIVRELVAGLAAGLADPAPFLELWRERLLHRPGAPLTVRLGSGETVHGTFGGVSDEGYLRLETGSGERVLSAGEVVEPG